MVKQEICTEEASGGIVGGRLGVSDKKKQGGGGGLIGEKKGFFNEQENSVWPKRGKSRYMRGDRYGRI